MSARHHEFHPVTDSRADDADRTGRRGCPIERTSPRTRHASGTIVNSRTGRRRLPLSTSDPRTFPNVEDYAAPEGGVGTEPTRSTSPEGNPRATGTCCAPESRSRSLPRASGPTQSGLKAGGMSSKRWTSPPSGTPISRIIAMARSADRVRAPRGPRREGRQSPIQRVVRVEIGAV